VSFPAGLDSSYFIRNGLDLIFANVKHKINCERAALMRRKFRDAAELSLNCPVAREAGTWFEACYISIFQGDRVFPKRKER
jgi:hypothetical protein